MNMKKIISLFLTVIISITGVTAVAVTPKVPFEEVDFSTLTAEFEYDNTYTSEEMENIYGNDIKSYGSSGNYRLVKDQNYGTSLQIYPQSAGTGGSVVMQLPETITSGRLEIIIKTN